MNITCSAVKVIYYITTIIELFKTLHVGHKMAIKMVCYFYGINLSIWLNIIKALWLNYMACEEQISRLIRLEPFLFISIPN